MVNWCLKNKDQRLEQVWKTSTKEMMPKRTRGTIIMKWSSSNWFRKHQGEPTSVK